MDTLDTNEKVQYVARKHWIVMVLRMSGLVIIAALPFLAYHVIPYFFAFTITPSWELVLSFVYTFFLALIWMMLFATWTDYYLDMWLITDRRVIDIEQRGLFSRNIAHVRYENIQDVTIEISGILNTLFGYGVVHIQTAGTEKEFTMKHMAAPHEVQSHIMQEVKRVHTKVQQVHIPDR